jgi:hypothetical protein
LWLSDSSISAMRRRALRSIAQPPRWAASMPAMSILIMPIIACMTRAEAAGSGSARSLGRASGMICQQSL